MNIQTREIHPVTQGSDDWRKLRGSRFTASEAPAALGMSRYVSRADLLHQKATGITKEPDDATQARFDRGHQAERSARPLAEKIIGEELAPLTMTADVDGLALLASMDGITMENDIVWETKLWNQELSEAVKTGDLPEHYTIQMDQQLLVSGASRCLFTCSDGTPERTVHCWYETSPEKVSRLIAGWDQFASDLAAYVPEDRPAPVTPAPMESLPAVVVQVQGALTVGGNLDAFGLALRDFIARIPARPATDQQFADAEAACKALKRAEDALAQAEDGALAQISDVELMRRTVADLKELARSTRLATEKLVKAEKDARRTEKVMAARLAFDKHVAACQLDIKGVRLNVPMPDFGAAIKGLSSLASIDDKLTDALISSQAEVNTLASRIINNLQTLDSVPAYAHLFADRQELAYKDGETLELLMQKRVDAEAARIEAERARIRAEEERKAREAAERAAEVTPGKPLAPAPIAAAPVAAGIAPDVATGSAADDAPTLTLGVINERLHPISISAAGLAEFGVEPLATRKAAKLYSQAQFEQACRAIVRCATDALRGEIQPGEPRKWPEMMGVNYDEPMRHGKEN